MEGSVILCYTAFYLSAATQQDSGLEGSAVLAFSAAPLAPCSSTPVAVVAQLQSCRPVVAMLLLCDWHALVSALRL